jgi:hypothetical protein
MDPGLARPIDRKHRTSTDVLTPYLSYPYYPNKEPKPDLYCGIAMNLIAYSDSEESDNETPQAPKPTTKPVSRPAFQKVVDRSNPGKIRLQLPTPSQAHTGKDDIEAEAPPAKKARTGAGTFSGFNAMLPAPKRPNVNAIAGASGAGVSGKRGLGKALGVGVNLKTGAEPAFRREPKVEDYDETGNPVKKNGTPMQSEDFRAMFNLPPARTNTTVATKIEEPPQQAIPAEPEVRPAKPKFLPLSVARGKKRKPIPPRATAATTVGVQQTANTSVRSPAIEPMPVAKPKISLFSMTEEDDVTAVGPSSHAAYQPLLYGVKESDDAPVPDATVEEAYTQTTSAYAAPGPAPNSDAHGLTDLASELNLTESQRRQLFGRKGQGPDLSTANIIEFNTDKEYAHNEELRQQGETIQHNALKSITGTGKNSLRSLINVATTQKDALEEHFASGRRNKREAGSKYGW